MDELAELEAQWQARNVKSWPSTGIAANQILGLIERARWSEKAMDIASRLVTNILSGTPTTDPADRFVVEFQRACEGYRAATDKRDSNQ